MKKISFLMTVVFLLTLTNIACNQSVKNNNGFNIGGEVDLMTIRYFFEKVSLNGKTDVLSPS
ncbi:MAG: hypothetical protein R2771_09975 [Saprospiraceae bacterium]